MKIVYKLMTTSITIEEEEHGLRYMLCGCICNDSLFIRMDRRPIEKDEMERVASQVTKSE